MQVTILDLNVKWGENLIKNAQKKLLYYSQLIARLTSSANTEGPHGSINCYKLAEEVDIDVFEILLSIIIKAQAMKDILVLTILLKCRIQKITVQICLMS